MSLVIYRKYRPKTFSEVVDQDHIKITLMNTLRLGRIPHAFLFSGPRGVGKTTIARILAKAVNCTNLKDAEPCNKCEICAEINNGQCLDLIEIDAASTRGIDDIRELREKIKFPPSKAKYKVFIIDEVHMLTREAFNALLKSLEEPPAHVIFILCTTEVFRIPATVISRCLRFDFRKINVKGITERLQRIAKSEKAKISPEALLFIAQESEGSQRDAESLLERVISLGDRSINLAEVKEILGVTGIKNIADFVDLLIKRDSGQAINLINKLLQDGFDLHEFTLELEGYLRRMLLIKILTKGKTPFDKKSLTNISDLSGFTDEQMDKIFEQSKNFLTSSLIANLIGIFHQTEQEFRNQDLPQLPLEMAIVKICEIQKPKASFLRSPSPELRKTTEDKQGKASVNPDAKKAWTKNNLEENHQVKKQDTKQSSPKQTDGVLNLDQIKLKWSGVIETTRKFNHSIAAFLKSCQPKKIEDKNLTITCLYDFYKEKLSEHKNRRIIEKVLNKIFNKKIRVSIELETNLKKSEAASSPAQQTNLSPDNSSPLTKKALEIFGGKIIK